MASVAGSVALPVTPPKKPGRVSEIGIVTPSLVSLTSMSPSIGKPSSDPTGPAP